MNATAQMWKFIYALTMLFYSINCMPQTSSLKIEMKLSKGVNSKKIENYGQLKIEHVHEYENNFYLIGYPLKSKKNMDYFLNEHITIIKYDSNLTPIGFNKIKFQEATKSQNNDIVKILTVSKYIYVFFISTYNKNSWLTCKKINLIDYEAESTKLFKLENRMLLTEISKNSKYNFMHIYINEDEKTRVIVLDSSLEFLNDCKFNKSTSPYPVSTFFDQAGSFYLFELSSSENTSLLRKFSFNKTDTSKLNTYADTIDDNYSFNLNKNKTTIETNFDQYNLGYGIEFFSNKSDQNEQLYIIHFRKNIENYTLSKFNLLNSQNLKIDNVFRIKLKEKILQPNRNSFSAYYDTNFNYSIDKTTEKINPINFNEYLKEPKCQFTVVDSNVLILVNLFKKQDLFNIIELENNRQSDYYYGQYVAVYNLNTKKIKIDSIMETFFFKVQNKVIPNIQRLNSNNFITFNARNKILQLDYKNGKFLETKVTYSNPELENIPLSIFYPCNSGFITSLPTNNGGIFFVHLKIY